MKNSIVGFQRLKDEYSQCPDFGIIYNESLDNLSSTQGNFFLRYGYLLKGVKLCIPLTSLRDFLVWEIHVGGFAGHFGRDKTIDLVED